MVPLEFTTFFAVLAGVGATLFGLIFVAITIRPEVAQDDTSSLLRPFQIASAYTALLNPLVISLLALVPHATIGIITMVMSITGLTSSGAMGISLFQIPTQWTKKVSSGGFLVVSLLIYGFEIFYSIRLMAIPHDIQTLYNLTTLLVAIYMYGIARAWDLVGARQFHIIDMIAPLLPHRIKKDLRVSSHEPSPHKPAD